MFVKHLKFSDKRCYRNVKYSFNLETVKGIDTHTPAPVPVSTLQTRNHERLFLSPPNAENVHGARNLSLALCALEINGDWGPS